MSVMLQLKTVLLLALCCAQPVHSFVSGVQPLGIRSSFLADASPRSLRHLPSQSSVLQNKQPRRGIALSMNKVDWLPAGWVLRKLALRAFTILAFFVVLSLRTVRAGNLGIETRFGKVSQNLYPSGLHVTTPFSRMYQFSTKTLLLEQQNHVPTKEGLTVDLDVAVLYHIDPLQAREIYLKLGKDYQRVVLEPEVSSAVRGLTSESEAKALYTEGRSAMQKRIKEELARELAPRGIVVESVLLKAVRLPDQLTKAIELKAQAEQESARMSFVLDKERQEADRKKIEAKGIADFQKIVSEGISPQLLKWKGIETTEKLAMSENAKVVIVGNNQGSLPVILSSDDK